MVLHFFEFYGTPYYHDTPENWIIVNHALCLGVERSSREEDIITACYVEICILRKDWIWAREDRGVRVSEKDI